MKHKSKPLKASMPNIFVKRWGVVKRYLDQGNQIFKNHVCLTYEFYFVRNGSISSNF